MKEQEWESKLAEIPFVSVVDSKSLFDCLNKLICIYAYMPRSKTKGLRLMLPFSRMIYAELEVTFVGSKVPISADPA